MPPHRGYRSTQVWVRFLKARRAAAC